VIRHIATFRLVGGTPALATVIDTAARTETVYEDDGETTAEVRDWTPPPPNAVAAATAALAALPAETAAQMATVVTFGAGLVDRRGDLTQAVATGDPLAGVTVLSAAVEAAATTTPDQEVTP
jgi:hypothetical protein